MNKLVVIESPGPIKLLGDIMGPIKTPCSISTNVIIDLINSGKVVYEVNPKNHNERVRLTRLNTNTNNFPSNNKSQIDSRREALRNRIRQHEQKIQKAIEEKNKEIPVIEQREEVVVKQPTPTTFVSNKRSRKKKRR